MLTASDTAFSIAAVRAEEGLRPPHERLFEDPYAILFRAVGGHAEAGTKRYLDLPFFRDGIRLRTRFIDDVLGKVLENGLDQIVLLGAGFDTRALRIPGIAARGARVYEIDLPDQLQRKRAVLVSGGMTLPGWVSYIPCDLTASDYEVTLARALEEVGFRRDRGALLIWEGVTTYIGVTATDRCLRFMATLFRWEARSCSMSVQASSAPPPSASMRRELDFPRARRMGPTSCGGATWPVSRTRPPGCSAWSWRTARHRTAGPGAGVAGSSCLHGRFRSAHPVLASRRPQP
jgi:methyltransferase (TIGR00027 family)